MTSCGHLLETGANKFGRRLQNGKKSVRVTVSGMESCANSLRGGCTQVVFACSLPQKTKCSIQKDCFKLEAAVTIPFTGSVQEFAQLLLNSFKLPCFLENELLTNLQEFIDVETKRYLTDAAEEKVQKVMKNELSTEGVIRSWEQAFREETLCYAPPEDVSNEEVFAGAFNHLVHSPVLETLLHVEHSYALAVQDLLQQRDQEISGLTNEQSKEMSQAVHKANSSSENEQVNRLAAEHFEDQHLLQIRWSSKLDALKESQMKNYSEWVMKAYEDYYTTKTMPALSQRLPSAKSLPQRQDEELSAVLEESFTIHLGSQMKQMYNIRLLAGDALGLCRHRQFLKSGCTEPNPQHLQTAISLYSNDLCGLVLLVDDSLSTYSGVCKEFDNVTQQSAEFHFPNYETQLETIKSELSKALEWRVSHPARFDVDEAATQGRTSSKNFQVGDFYVTRHSNLSNIHIVFHLVVDDSLKSGDINSRHPAILGIRNILKLACLNAITTITVPALLVHEISENMTVPWCTKRAELVYKCVKGFMIEMTSWGGSELKNLQFLVPKGISEDVFNSLATLLPSIFRISNPLRLKPSIVSYHKNE